MYYNPSIFITILTNCNDFDRKKIEFHRVL